MSHYLTMIDVLYDKKNNYLKKFSSLFLFQTQKIKNRSDFLF